MAHFMLPSIFGAACGIILAGLSLILFLIRKNENSRKTLYFLCLLLGCAVTMEFTYNFTGDHRVEVDSRKNQWEGPLFHLIQGSLLSVILGIMFGLDPAYMGANVLLVSAATLFWEFSMLGGSTADQKPDAMWFMFAVTALFWMYVLKARDTWKHSSPTIWIFMIASGFGVLFFGGQWLSGPEFLNLFNTATKNYAIGLLGSIFLFFFVPIGVIIFHGEKPMVNRLVEAKNRIFDRSTNV